MRGSERQRPDVVQLAKAFGRAADAKIAMGNTAPKSEIILKLMLEYNKSQRVNNCKIEGDERQAVKFLAQCPEVWGILRSVWNDFRVRESPITAAILAAPYVTNPPAGLTAVANPKWFQYLLPTAAKHQIWLRRLDLAFRARVERARREGKSPSLQSRAVALRCLCRGLHFMKLAWHMLLCWKSAIAERWPCTDRDAPCGHMCNVGQGHYRESDNLATFQVCMLWGSLSSEISVMIGPHKFEELQGMFFRGSLDRDLLGQVKLKNEDFELKTLGFLQTQEDVEMAAQTSRTSATSSEFNLLKIRLKAEQTAWVQYLAQVHAWRSKTHQAKHDLNTTIYNLRVAAVDSHCAASFAVYPCEKTNQAWHWVGEGALVDVGR